MIERLKPFGHPRLWLNLWGLAIAGVIVLSLTPPAPLPPLPSGTDKIEHALAYAMLASGAVQLFRERGTCWAIGAALVMLGIGLEFAQGAYTADRMQDPFDALANAVGVFIGLSTRATPMRDWLMRRDPRKPLA